LQTTRHTLLRRVRDVQDADAWEEFVGLYTPLLYRYARARGLDHDQAEEIAQQCMCDVARKMPEFEYDPRRGRFKGWLKTIANNNITSALRKHRPRLADSVELQREQIREKSVEEIWEQQWQQEHFTYALDLVRQDVKHETFEAFRLLVIEELPVLETAERLGLTTNQVYVAKHRVIHRIKAKIAELTEGNP
jgi:RNA polymerase sigma factor (sigma-70 family)